MLRVDKRIIEDVRLVMSWSQNDDFWKFNILSASKLREKFDQLYMKAKEQKPVGRFDKEKVRM